MSRDAYGQVISSRSSVGGLGKNRLPTTGYRKALPIVLAPVVQGIDERLLKLDFRSPAGDPGKLVDTGNLQCHVRGAEAGRIDLDPNVPQTG